MGLMGIIGIMKLVQPGLPLWLDTSFPFFPSIPSVVERHEVDRNDLNHVEHHRSLFWSLVAVVQPGLGHPFAQAAVFNEFFFQRLQLLI